jgi:hypothetical protein
MRALRVVGYDEEGVVILEDPDRRERFTVPADERLRAAARGDVQRLGQMSMELESQLRPREIQARIRAGASVEQVATAAGVPHQRIERFAYPVLLERSRIADLARQAHPVREDGPDVRTLDEIVSHTFGLRGQEYEHAEWDAWRGDDNKWVAALSWRVGRSDIRALWGYQPGSHGGTVSALDEHATDLVDGQLSRPPRRLGPVIDFSKPDAGHPDIEEAPEEPGAGGEPLGRTGGERPGSSRTAATSAPGVSRAGAARATAGGPGSAGQDPGRRATKTTTGRGAAGARSAPATERSAPSAQTEEETTDTPASASSAAASKRGGRKSKPVMPSWEDVLLGVKSQRN